MAYNKGTGVDFRGEGGNAGLGNIAVDSIYLGSVGSEQALVTNVLNGSKTIDPASIAASGTQTQTITVTGAALGDFVLVSAGVDLAGLVVTAYVSAADTVTIVLFNPTAGAIDLASSTWKVRVIR